MSNNVYEGGGSDIPEEPDETFETEGNVASEEIQLQAAEAELWTMSEMEEAEPCQVIEITDDMVAKLAQVEEEKPDDGDTGGAVIAGGEPELDLDSDQITAEDIDTLAGYSYPPPFTRWENFCSYKLFPFRTVGKLFFERDGKRYVCSAASIGGCAIWTAGHCVHSGNNKPGGWSKRVVFVPAYRDGSAPYGQWPAKQLFTRTAWYRYGIPKGLSEDMGGAILHRNKGRKISQRVGWLGFAWNWSRTQHWVATGYPAARPFNGKRQIITAASHAYNGNVGRNPAPVGIGCDMTGGCSGGPWIWRFGAGNYLNGDNSYRRSNKPKELYSPYFGNAARSLHKALLSVSC